MNLFASPSRALPAVIDEWGGVHAGRSGPLAWLQQPAVLEAAREALLASLPHNLLAPFAPVAERRRAVVAALRAATHPALRRLPDDADLLYELYAATLGWGPAQRYLDDPQVNEVKLIGATIRVQEGGRPFATVSERFPDAAAVLARVQLLASTLGVTLDGSTPQQTLPVAHGTRMHATIPPRVQSNDVLVCIRRGRSTPWTLDDLLVRGTLDEPVAALLQHLCAARASFLVIGPTGAGKTALLEALANSWPGDPHVVTLEDHTLEIGIRSGRAWTRELVDTHRDPDAFGRVAREALRQTPDLLLPGEVRGNEAGAILALLMSDHPVGTTIHARSGAEGLRRFARCAALPGSYMYAGRYADALEDAAAGFDVLIKVESWPDSGRRVITEISVPDVARSGAGRSVPTLPLATLALDEQHQPRWQVAATATAGTLHWHDPAVEQALPPTLRHKLLHAAHRHSVTPPKPGVAVVAAALERASTLLEAGAGARAIEALRPAWAEQHTPALLRLAGAALALEPQLHAQAVAGSAAARAELEALLEARHWRRAGAALDSLLADLVVAAAAQPDHGWEAVAEQIRSGDAAAAEAEALFDQVRQLLAARRPRAALELLDAVDRERLAGELLAAAEQLRVAALEPLVAGGDAALAALDAARERLAALAGGTA